MRPSAAIGAGAVVLLLACAVGLQVLRERVTPLDQAGASGNLLYVRSPAFATRAALSYRSLAADVYWIRAIQHYGRTRLSLDQARTYDILFPLLDLTTSLDPAFSAAYRFGAIFLAEPPPAGPGRSDQAVALLEKGLRAEPDRWEYAQDIGFVYYWWEHDYGQAASWFQRAATIEGAPSWLGALAAVTLTEGGHRDTSRKLWQEIIARSEPDEEWLRTQAEFRLRQLDALDQIAELQGLVDRYRRDVSPVPGSWRDLVRDRYLPGIPVDSDGKPFRLDPQTGAVSLDPGSTLNPLPTGDRPAQ